MAIFKGVCALLGLNPPKEFVIMFIVGYLRKNRDAAFFEREKETRKW